MKIKLTEYELKNWLTETVHTILKEAYTNVKEGIVNYIKSFGHKGKLPSFSGSIKDLYKTYFNEAYEWASKSTDDVLRYGKVWAEREIYVETIGKWRFNKRGLIYVERSIDLLLNNNELEMSDLNYKSVGECWSWKKSNSRSYCSNFSLLDKTANVVICGYVHPESIDWLETIYLNLYNMKNETEIRLNDNAFVETSYILIDGVKHSLGGSYIVNASSDKYNKNKENW